MYTNRVGLSNFASGAKIKKWFVHAWIFAWEGEQETPVNTPETENATK